MIRVSSLPGLRPRLGSRVRFLRRVALRRCLRPLLPLFPSWALRRCLIPLGSSSLLVRAGPPLRRGPSPLASWPTKTTPTPPASPPPPPRQSACRFPACPRLWLPCRPVPRPRRLRRWPPIPGRCVGGGVCGRNRTVRSVPGGRCGLLRSRRRSLQEMTRYSIPSRRRRPARVRSFARLALGLRRRWLVGSRARRVDPANGGRGQQCLRPRSVPGRLGISPPVRLTIHCGALLPGGVHVRPGLLPLPR